MLDPADYGPVPLAACVPPERPGVPPPAGEGASVFPATGAEGVDFAAPTDAGRFVD